MLLTVLTGAGGGSTQPFQRQPSPTQVVKPIVCGVGSGVLTDIGTRVIDASNLRSGLVFGDDGLKQTNSADAVTITGGRRKGC